MALPAGDPPGDATETWSVLARKREDEGRWGQPMRVQLLLLLMLWLHTRGLALPALAFTIARMDTPCFPSCRLEGRRPAVPRQGLTH